VIALPDCQIAGKAIEGVVVGPRYAFRGGKPELAQASELGDVFVRDVVVGGALDPRACCRAIEQSKPTLRES
jgi:hypothetical protein